MTPGVMTKYSDNKNKTREYIIKSLQNELSEKCKKYYIKLSSASA